MESPLDVLSRAASAVETNGSNGDLNIHNHNVKATSLKELPTRVNRQRRSTERRDLLQALQYEDAHSKSKSGPSSFSTRCASTQTIISTVRQEASELVGIPSVNPALPPPSTSSRLTHIPIAVMSSSYIPSNTEPRQHRPTVINRAPSTAKDSYDFEQVVGSTADASYSLERIPKDQKISQGDVCDEIEEHFRRSLGRDYQGSVSPTNSATAEDMSISGSVDDHFAKALGDKWNQLKSRVSPTRVSGSPPNTPTPAALTSQVFQHASFVSS